LSRLSPNRDHCRHLCHAPCAETFCTLVADKVGILVVCDRALNKVCTELDCDHASPHPEERRCLMFCSTMYSTRCVPVEEL
jgi:hypothetical protein